MAEVIAKTTGFETPKGEKQVLIICGLINCLLFGVGVIIAGILAGDVADIIIGVLQLCLPFVGWVWAVIWGVLMIVRSDYVKIG